MKNKEKYFDEIVETFIDGGFCIFAQDIMRVNCNTYRGCIDCKERAKQWFNQEYEEPLKPCPFCGGKAELTKPDDSHYFARCTNPECIIAPKTIITRSKEEIVEAWNMRILEK